MKLSSKLSKEEIKEFFKIFDLNSKIFYGVILLVTYTIYFKLAVDLDHGILPMTITLFVIPIIIVPFNYTTSFYVYRTNTFRSVTRIFSMIAYVVMLTQIALLNYDSIGEWNLVGVGSIYVIFFGGLLGIFTSIPYKVIQLIVFGEKKLYFSGDLREEIDKYISGETEKKEKVKQQSLSYETMNETQLEAELNYAIKSEDYETASIIREVLDKKYRD